VTYQLDKDIKVQGNKLYSPDTCLFVTQEQNLAARKTGRSPQPFRYCEPPPPAVPF